VISRYSSKNNCTSYNFINSFSIDVFQPGVEAGDVVIVIHQKAHEQFKRQGDDLHLMLTISLTEALCGFCYVLKVKLYSSLTLNEIVSF